MQGDVRGNKEYISFNLIYFLLCRLLSPGLLVMAYSHVVFLGTISMLALRLGHTFHNGY